VKKRSVAITQIRIFSKEKKYINGVLNLNRLAYDPFTQKFESKFAKVHNQKYAIFTNSGTSWLHVALHAVEDSFDGGKPLQLNQQ